MILLYNQQWFIKTINWLREKSPWFERWIWGYSKNIQDFVRNPAEELMDYYPPFCIQNVKGYSLLFRSFFIPYKEELILVYLKEIKDRFPGIDISQCIGTYHPYPHKGIGFNIGKYRVIDISFGEQITKYPNAGFALQFIFCMKWKVIPIPFISICLRLSKIKYFQLGFGWGPQWKNYHGRYPGDTTLNARLSIKLRIAKYIDEKGDGGELFWNPGSEVYGFWEGNV